MRPIGTDDQMAPPPEPTGIVSVNSRGGTASGRAGKLVFLLLVLALMLVGCVIGVNKYLAAKKADAASQRSGAAENKPASVAARRTFNTDPPALPSGAAARAAAAGAEAGMCADHSAGLPLLGPDGKAMYAPSGQPIRVCANGQVIVPMVPTVPAMPIVPALQPMPGEAAAMPTDASARSGPPLAAAAPASRYGGDVLLPALAPAPTLDPNNPLIQALLGRNGLDGAASDQAGTAAALPGFGAGAQAQVASLQRANEPTAVRASWIGNRDMILPQGRSIDCNLSMRLVSEVSGKATCVLSSNVYSDNGRVVLAERGSVAVGDYVALAAQGQRRVFILWTRLQTPTGAVISIDSPAADALGTTGLGGYVDNRWPERIGAAVLLSLVEDAIGYQTAKAAGGDGGGAAQGIALFQNTTQTGRGLAERILDSTINIKPTIYKNQGDRATIFVSRDLDFGSVYALRAK